MKKLLAILLVSLPTHAANTALVYPNNVWKVINGFALNCPSINVVSLDFIGGTPYTYQATGGAVCSNGKLIPVTGTALLTSSTAYISLYIAESRISCTLPTTTLSGTCGLYDSAGVLVSLPTVTLSK